MQFSLVYTLANKHRTSASRIFKKYRSTVEAGHGTLKVLEVRQERDGDKEPLVELSRRL